MRPVTLEQLADILEVMIINQTIDSGFSITHFGTIEGLPIIAISTCRGAGGGFIIQ
jgi:hypothetical protein